MLAIVRRRATVTAKYRGLARAVFLVLLLARKFGPAREVVKTMRELISRNSMSQSDGLGGKKADGSRE
jgi:hypothetical protein